ncbi:hypothetical protein SUGI_0262180 [Cryptomeria japonica]|nr:hypothetical protein SUGI_0262180 [Cryptomeria japonica]
MEIIINREDIEMGFDELALKSLTPDIVSEVLRTTQRKFLRNAESHGTQKGSRRRSPIVQRYLWKEAQALEENQPIKGPPARRNPLIVKVGVDKALRFYSWAEEQSGLEHTQLTCQEMAWTLARANKLKMLWRFLHEMARKEKADLVTTKTVTSVIKVLGEEGLVKEALACFYRMKQFHCKPDLIAYNTIIYALCRVGNFRKARFLFDQMKRPWSRCPPDTFTYTILISCHCKYSMQTGNSKVVGKKLYEANRLFRDMCDDGFVPDVVTYNCLIDGLCKKYRIDRALELFHHMSQNGCAPNKVTYNSFIRYYSTVNEMDKAEDMMKEMKRNNITPTCSSYTPILHALCEMNRLDEARKLLIEMVEEKSIPRSYTYELITGALRKAGHTGLPADLCEKIELGIEARHKYVKTRSIFNSRVLIHTIGYSNSYIVRIVNSAPIYQGTAAEEDVRVFSLAHNQVRTQTGNLIPGINTTTAAQACERKVCKHTSPTRV